MRLSERPWTAPRGSRSKRNGIRFSAYEAGEGPLLLCLHGFPDHPRSFRHQIGPLVDAGHRVVVPYMRGYAPTSAPEDGCYQLAALARDAIGLIEALGEESATIFGHDWGGISAYAAAVLAPERVSRLVNRRGSVRAGVPREVRDVPTSSCAGSWYIFVFQQPMAEIAVSQDDCAFIANLWRDWSPTWEAPPEEVTAVRELLGRPEVLAAALGYYRAMFDPTHHRADLAEDEAKMKRHAGRGADDVSARARRRLHGRGDGGRDGGRCFPAGLDLQVIEDAGHFLHQEKPDEINRLVLEFLARP